MYKNMRERSYTQATNRNPSFSSSLLDQIYRSFDDAGSDSQNTPKVSGFYSSNPVQNQIKKIGKERAKTEETDRWVSETSLDRKTRRFTSEFDHLHRHFLFSHTDADQDSMFFSSGSSSSESSSSWVSSSSDTEFMSGNKSAKPSCVDPPRPRPVRTGGSAKADKTEKRKKSTLLQRNRDASDSGGYGARVREEENNLIKSESRAMKIYNNLKKVKQPISPGGRLASFLNSLLNVKKSTGPRRFSDDGFTGKSSDSIKSDPVATCNSASSYSRSCLSKHSPSTRDKLRKNGQKRSVTFNYPVSVVFGAGDSMRMCGHKSLENYEDGSAEVSVSVANAWQIGKSAAAAARKSSSHKEEEVGVVVKEKSKRVEEMAREILREYEKKKMKEFGLTRSSPSQVLEDHDDDDVMSCSSSELFELDLVGNGRFADELPVYETTHVGTNRAIASGLIV